MRYAEFERSDLSTCTDFFRNATFARASKKRSDPICEPTFENGSAPVSSAGDPWKRSHSLDRRIRQRDRHERQCAKSVRSGALLETEAFPPLGTHILLELQLANHKRKTVKLEAKGVVNRVEKHSIAVATGIMKVRKSRAPRKAADR